MCKSASSSLLAFGITGVSMSIVYMISRRPEDLFAALLLVTISLMQLVDAALWTYKDINMFLSKYGIPAVLILELLVSYYGIRHFFGWSHQVYEVTLWIACAVLIYRWLSTCKGTGVYMDGYLHWCNTNIEKYAAIAFVSFLLFPILIGFPNTLLKWIIVGLTLFTFIWNFWYDTFGTRWCWMGNMGSIVILGIVVYERFLR